jgi:hypothetical protein
MKKEISTISFFPEVRYKNARCRRAMWSIASMHERELISLKACTIVLAGETNLPKYSRALRRDLELFSSRCRLDRFYSRSQV